MLTVPPTGVPISFNVTPENDPPIAGHDFLAAMPEDASPRAISILNLLTNDVTGPPDEFNQSLTFSLGQVSGGTATVSAGIVVFVPATNYFGPAGFQYAIIDNGTTAGLADPRSDNAFVSIPITEVNDPPIGGNDTLASIAEDSSGFSIPLSTLLGNDSAGPDNEEPQSLTIVDVMEVSGGSVEIQGTNILFSPAPDFNGTAAFLYMVEDNGITAGVADPRTDTVSVQFTITEVNDPPVPQNDILSSSMEDAPPRIIPWETLLLNDISGPPNETNQLLNIVSVGNATGGIVTLSDNTVVFTFSPSYNGIARFTYSVQDDGLSRGANDPKREDAEVVFMVLPVNDAPLAFPQIVNVSEDSSVLVTLDGTDGDPELLQTLSIRVTDLPDHGNLTVVSGQTAQYLYSPFPNYTGPDSFQFTVTDDGNAGPPVSLTSDPATVSIEVRSGADAPSVTPATTREGQQSTNGLVITANSADVGVTHYRISRILNGDLFQNDGVTGIAEGGFVTMAQGLAGLKFTPRAGVYSPIATFSFDVQASTSPFGSRLGAISTASVIVLPNFDFGDAPAPPYSTLLTNDGARHVVLSTGPVLYLGLLPPDTDRDGQPSSASNGDDLAGRDDEDGASLPSVIVPGKTYTLSVEGSGAGWLNIWIDWNRNGNWNDIGDHVLSNDRLENEGVTFSFLAPAFTAVGETSVRLRFSTVSGLGPTGMAPDGEVEDFPLTLALNRVPVTLKDAIVRYVHETGKISVQEVLANDSDSDGDSLSIVSIPSILPSGARVKRDNGWIIYEPPTGFHLPENFPYTLSDGRGGTAEGIIEVSVVGEDQPLAPGYLRIQMTENGVVVQFKGVPGRSYEIQTTTDLSSPWVSHSSGIQVAGPDGLISIIEDPSSSTRFYRAREH